jgi:hypothetical protein
VAKSNDTPEAVPPAEKKDGSLREPAEPRRGVVRSAFAALGQFAVAVVWAPLVLVRGRKHAESVVVYSAHPSFFLWLLILAGFVSAWVVNKQWLSPEVAGWIYVWVLVYFIVTLLYDLSTRGLALWIGIFSLIWLLSKYVEHVRNIALLGYVFSYLAELRPKLDPGTVTVLSWVLLLPWIGSVLYMVFNGRKRFTPNEIGEFHFGEGSELTDRSGLRFRTKFRDVLEMILTFGGGDLLAVDNHQNVIKRWDNIIGLYFSWKDLDRILHQRSVVDEESADDDDNQK